jgi:hypothetical protein
MNFGFQNRVGEIQALKRYTATLGVCAAFLTGGVLLTGCGGGTGGDAGNSDGGDRTRVSVTVQWPARSRSIGAPQSALSGQVILQGAAAGGGDFNFLLNRDANRPEAYTQNFQSNTEANKGVWQGNITFFSAANGQGSPVANATKTVDLTQSGEIGDVTLTNEIASVEVVPNQRVAVGQTLLPQFVARTAGGVQIAVSPESGTVNVVGGQGAAGVQDGRLRGNAPGLAQITVSLDGRTSAPQTVGIGEASLTLAANGPRGYVPYSVTQTGRGTTYLNIADIAPFTVSADWFAVATIAAPENYGDRQFVKWQFNGADLANTPTLNFSLVDRGQGTLTAVYGPRTVTNDQYLPNFFQASFKRWVSYPVKVFLDTDATKQALIRQAMDFWVAAAGDRISYQIVGSLAESDISFRFGNTGGARGFCDSQWDGQDRLIQADITLENALTGAGREEDLKLAARHEFGHALGLTGEQPGAGHSPDANDTMFANGNPLVNVITARDINTLTTLYPTVLGRSRSAGETLGPVAGRARVTCGH